MITPAIATCESILAKLGLGKDFKDVEVRDHACGDINVIKSCTILDPTVQLISPSHPKTIAHSVRLALAVNQ